MSENSLQKYQENSTDDSIPGLFGGLVLLVLPLVAITGIIGVVNAFSKLDEILNKSDTEETYEEMDKKRNRNS